MRWSEEFNARGRPASEVARTFVAPLAQFEPLLTGDNHILIGPRGSGKTTLLKMLTVDAISTWRHPDAGKYAEQLQFNGVFIQTDRAWSAQLSSLKDDNCSPNAGAIADAAFALHTLISLTLAMQDAVRLFQAPLGASFAHLSAKLSQSEEEEFCKLVEATLDIPIVPKSLLGLEASLRRTLLRIRDNSQFEKIRGTFCSVNLMPLISSIISYFGHTSGSPNRRWGFLFDELEIAPTEIVKYLIAALRGTDNKITLKLALAPFQKDLDYIAHLTAPIHKGHDYTQIELTYAYKDDAFVFSKDLTRRIFEDRGILDDPSLLFEEPSPVSARRSKRGEKFRLPEVFHELAERDASFKAFATRRHLFEKNYEKEAERAADVRKVLPIVQARAFYLRDVQSAAGTRDSDGQLRRRPRKTLQYGGFPTIIEITEGNPRVIHSLMVPLARELALLRESNANVRVPLSSQIAGIRSATHVLASLLRSIPAEVRGRPSKRGLLGFLDIIGYYFRDRLLKDKFEPDFRGTFELDSNAPDSIVTAVGNALNVGALIYIPEQNSISAPTPFSRLRGKRYRISYLLSPQYSLPLTLGVPVALKNILDKSESKFVPDLFSGENKP